MSETANLEAGCDDRVRSCTCFSFGSVAAMSGGDGDGGNGPGTSARLTVDPISTMTTTIYSSFMTATTLLRPLPVFRPVVRALTLRCCAEKEGAVYEGMYGSWTIDDQDRREVMLYRVGLSVCASSFALGTALSFAPEAVAAPLYNPLCFLSAAGFGLSLTQVHMYAADIKRAIQLLWFLGVAGGLYVASTGEAALPLSVVQNPGDVWLVGPFFAAMTGLAIKEGLCYGKAEAALLTFLIPTTLLGHLTQSIPVDLLHGLVATCAVLFGVLAGRKYSQPVKDDIGDKSIFKFLSLPESEQNEILERLQ